MGLSCSLKNKAFSLLELIVAIAVLSVGIVVVLQALSHSAQAAGLSCDIINAVFLTQDEMQELEFKEKQNLINREPRQIKEKEGRFEWNYILNPDPGLNLYRVDFNVTWQRSNRAERLNLNTYLR